MFALAGCGVQNSAPAADVPPTAVAVSFKSLAELQYSGLEQAGLMVLRTAVEWANLWSTATQGIEPAQDVPAVDFTRRMVLVAAMGARATGGFEIQVGAIYEDAERLYAVYTETSPGPDCFTTQAFTAPLSAVSIPFSRKQVQFVKRTNVRICG